MRNSGVLLIVALAAIAVFAAQNTGVMDVTLWQYHWAGIPQWLPVIAAAVGIAALFLLYMALAGLLTGLRQWLITTPNLGTRGRHQRPAS